MKSAKVIVETLKKAAHAYYETGSSIMTDEEYDVLREKLYGLDPENPYFNEVGSLPEVGRITLPHAMPSLRKIKPDTIDTVRLKGPFIITDKLDGISAMWTCGMNRKSGLYLRGNGLVGQDVSHIKVQGLKQVLANCSIRGELIVPRSVGVARNWVNGILHQSSASKEDCMKIHFVAYQVIEPSGLTRSQQITWLQNQGFEVPGYTVVNELKAEEMTRLFKKTREESLYECDGIVVGTDTIPLVTTEALPKDAFAYKVAVDDQRAETTVRAIEWASSRMAEWIPRIRFDPVRIGSATIEFCTGVHAQYIKEHMLGPGAKIVVRRSGDVIPTLDRVITPAATWQEPPQGRWKWDGIHAMDTTQEKTSDTLALEMAHSLISLGVEGLSATSTKKIVEGGFRDLKTVWSCTEAQLQVCIGKVSGSKLRKALDGLKATELQWVHAYPSWPKGFGEKKIVSALEAEPNLSKWPKRTTAPAGQTMATFSEVCKHVPAYLEWRKGFPLVAAVAPLVVAAPVAVAVKGYYVMTGFRDAELSAKLLEKGWIVQDRINKDTTVLLVADNRESTKTKAAKEKGVRIVLRDQANTLF
jgi:NAD-dependent DNA ligase